MQELDFSQSSAYFDFKAFVINILSHWYWFVICVGIGLGIAYYVSVRKLPVYKMESLITIKDDQNPLFTNSNTSLTFNWGGQSSKTSSAITTLKTRTHNEKVVKHLQYYLHYQLQGEYQLEDAYGRTPFNIELNENAYHLKGQLMNIKLIDDSFFEISFEIQDQPKTLTYYNYSTEHGFTEKFDTGTYKEKFEIGVPITSKFFSGKLERIDGKSNESEIYFISLQDFNSVVKKYQNINVGTQEQGSSIIQLELIGENKKKMVDYLNATTSILSKTQLDQKNLFATKTIKFIDSTLNEKAEELEAFEDELNKYKIDNNIIDLDSEAQQLKQNLINYDIELKNLNRQLDYLNILEKYLSSRTTYEDPPAPSIAGIEEGSIVSGVKKIVELSLERSKYQYAAKPDLPEFKDIDRQIDATKKVLNENIESSKQNIFREISNVEKDLRQVEKEVQKLPSSQQGLLKIERRFNISQQTYDLFLAKRNEAKLIKASNVSDILIIDEAKDVGNPKIGPNNQLNYVMAVFFGLGVPLVYIFFLVLLDNRINTPEDIERLTDLPLIGLVGKSKKGDLSTLEQPNSIISESFRNIRTSLQFIFMNNELEGCKTIMVTSSFSGEGKTFNAINLASVLSIGGKKTAVVGLDLRKPKIHKNFEIVENIGVSTYITGQNTYEEITQSSGYDNFDIVASGKIPPNPSEMLISQKMQELMQRLKEDYEYVILDTPPIGLVSDALNLIKYADATLYIIRQYYTKKGMLNLINNKHNKGEIKNVYLVFNYYKAKQKLGYGYGYGYSYGYGKYGKGYGYANKEKQRNNIFNRLNNLFK